MATIAEALQTAVAHHRAGRRDLAKSIYEQILHVAPHQPDALNLLGVIYSEEKNFAAAAELFQRAVTQGPEIDSYHFHWGLALKALQRWQEAAAAFARACELQATHVESWSHLGACRLQLGAFEEGLFAYCQALLHSPRHQAAETGFRAACGRLNLSAASTQQFREAIFNTHPASLADWFYQLGAAHHQQGRTERFHICLELALKIDPRFAPGYNARGILNRAAGRYDEAVADFRQAVQWAGDHEGSVQNLSAMLVERGEFAAAEEQLRTFLARAPQAYSSHMQLGKLYFDQAQLDAAETCYRTAAQLQPHQPYPHVSLGMAYMNQRRFAEAHAAFEQALSLDPQCADAHLFLGLLHLMVGDYETGWREYEWRWKTKGWTPSTLLPLWDGSPLPGQGLLVTAEQGIGDEIMFASCIPDLMPRVERCVLACEPRLVPLFARSFPQVQVVSTPTLRNRQAFAELGPLHAQCSLGGLPRFLRNQADQFPRREAYLSPNVERVRYWRERLKATHSGVNIGLSWRGGMLRYNKRCRTTSLTDWSRVLAMPHVQWVSVQYDVTEAELTAVEVSHGLSLRRFAEINPLQDMDDFANFLAALDLVISVDNSTVHLAGALGVPVWVALPFASDWRWLLTGNRSLWYSSVRLFRQAAEGDWEQVMEHICCELDSFLASQRS